MLRLRPGVLLLPVILLAACGSSGGNGGNGGPPGSSGKLIRATQGGVVESGGARLTIPPGALTQDTTVTLDVRSRPIEPDSNPLRSVGPAVNVDLGGASLQAAADLVLPVTERSVDGTPVIVETRPSDADGEPLLWVHAPRPGGASSTSQPGTATQALSGAGLSATLVQRVLRVGLYTPYAIPKPAPNELAAGRPLQVPFYWQAGLPWCTPTSLAMTLNYFKPLVSTSHPKFPSGYASNYGLASLIRQDPNSGSSAADILKAAGILPSAYRWMRWDAELIASDGSPSDGTFNAFVSYVALATTGVFGLTTPRPVWTSSDRLWHAFVVTGATSDALYINDSNDLPAYDWAGHHRTQTLKAFRAANCTLKDSKDPSKGCVDAGGGAADPDLYTLLFDAAPKPESERRGSLMLSHGGTLYSGGGALAYLGSVVVQSPANQDLSDWEWDGTYPNGYLFSDAATHLQTFPLGFNLPQSRDFRTSLFRSARFRTSVDVINVTDLALDYTLEARLENAAGATAAQKVATLNVKPYNDGSTTIDFGTLTDTFGAVSAPTDARLTLTLLQGGVTQDVKRIAFSIAPDPTDPPQVRILVPSAPTTLIKGVPFTFKGEGSDSHSLPDGEAALAWTEAGATLGNGPEFTLTPAAAGTRRLTLVARGEYGTTATASVTVTVIDPTLTPGQISIVQPAAHAAYWSPTTNVAVVDVPLAGVATYSDGALVPGNRLVWTAQAQGDVAHEVGRGSSLTAQLVGGRNTPLPYVIRLTVLSDSGTPIGTSTVDITVGFTYIG